MFNIQPGTGLGFSSSKEIALGLGTAWAFELPILEEEIIKAGSFGPKRLKPWEAELRQIMEEDEEILQILIQVVTSDIL